VTEQTQQKSFLQQWGVLIVFGALAAGALIGFRYWIESKAEAPVADAYRAYLEYAANRSPSARQYLTEYYAKFSRSTVASKHFQYVCGVVTMRAESETVDMAAFSKDMAAGCRSFAKYSQRGDAP
jgi:predicted negative regulator of RcsB-dependent stress response